MDEIKTVTAYRKVNKALKEDELLRLTELLISDGHVNMRIINSILNQDFANQNK